MSVKPVGRGRLDIGDVLGDTFGVIGANLPVFAAATMVLLGVPAALQVAGVVLARTAPIFGLLSLLGVLALLVGVGVLYGGLIHETMQALHGQPATFGMIIRQGLRKFWPIAGWSLLLVLGIVLAIGLLLIPWRLLHLSWPQALGLEALLLTIPGIILGVVWSAALPSLVIDNYGVFGSFKRSAELTRGRRWSIFLPLLIATVVTIVVELGLAAMFGGFGAGSRTSLYSTYVSPLLNLITFPFGLILNTAMFNQLRGKEGYGSEAVAEVFA